MLLYILCCSSAVPVQFTFFLKYLFTSYLKNRLNFYLETQKHFQNFHLITTKPSSDCVYMRWSRWSPCSSSCGPSIKQRYSKSLATRSVANRHQHRTNYYPNADRFNRGKQTSNKECPDKIQRALCKLSSCPM